MRNAIENITMINYMMCAGGVFFDNLTITSSDFKIGLPKIPTSGGFVAGFS